MKMIEGEQMLLKKDQVTLLAIHKLIKKTNGLPFETIKHLLKKEITNSDDIDKQKMMKFGIEMEPLNPEDEGGMLGDLVRTSDIWSDLLKSQDSDNPLENTLGTHFKGLETKVNGRYKEIVEELRNLRWGILHDYRYDDSKVTSTDWEPVCIADAMLFADSEGDESLDDIASVNVGWPRCLRLEEQINALYALEHMLISCASESWLDFTKKGGEACHEGVEIEYIIALGLERCIRYTDYFICE